MFAPTIPIRKYFQFHFPDLYVEVRAFWLRSRQRHIEAAVRFHVLAILLYLNKFLPLGKIQVHLDENGVVRFQLRRSRRVVA